MKKLILLAALGTFTFGEATAQFPLQNFNSATLPAGWSMIKVDNNTPGTGLNGWIVNQLTNNAWMLRTRTAGSDSCMLTTSMFTPAGTADRWLLSPNFTVNDPNMVLTWEDAAGIANVTDSIEVWVSPTAGTTVPSFTNLEYQAPVGPLLVYTTHGVALGAYNGQNIRVAFRNHSTNKGTLRLDNVQGQIPANLLDAAAMSITFPKLNGPTSTNSVKVDVKNNGAQNITSMTMTYTLDGGTPVSQNFTGLNISPYSTSTLTFTQQIVNPAAGPHTIAVAITLVNTVTDPVTNNNTLNTTFAVATQTVQRAGLIEEFSSSTCPPCQSFNLVFDPLAVAQNANNPTSNFNLIKYQMNWPSPGTDRAYNAHGDARKTFYGVSGIPDHYTNGMPGTGSSQATLTTEIANSKVAPAYMNISGSYIINSNTVNVSVSVTPYFTLTGGNYSLHVAAVQKSYHLQDATTTVGQYDFVYVMRRMFPNGGGTAMTTFTSGTPIVNNWNAQPFLVNPAPLQNSLDFFVTPISSDLVAFVQDNTTGEVLQSKSIPAAWPADVANIANDTKVMIFPNPASDYTVIGIDMQTAGDVHVNITDALGRVVYTHTEAVGTGRRDLTISTINFAAGLYNVTVQTEKGSLKERLTVVK